MFDHTMVGPSVAPPSTTAFDQHRTLVLNADETPIRFPLDVMNARDALKALSLGRMERVRDSRLVAHSETSEVVLPSVVRLKRQIHVRNLNGTAPLTRFNLLIRDRGLCQYTGREVRYNSRDPDREATVDHVVPRCQGGGNAWQNWLLACRTINEWKAGRRPKEAGLAPLTEPWVPTNADLLSLWLIEESLRNVGDDWLDYLAIKPTPKVQRILEMAA